MREQRVRIACSVKTWSLEAIYGAAYILTDRAYAQISGNPKSSLTITLKPKTAGGTASPIKKAFLEELRTQKIRWEIAKNNQAIRKYIMGQAVALAQNPPAPPAPAAVPELTAEERQEIERLIAEVESEIKERKKSAADPLNISATWEQRHALETKAS